MHMGITTREITPRDVIASLVRHRGLALTTGVGAMVLVLLVTFRTTPLYQASATLAMEPKSKAVEFESDLSVGRVDFSSLNTARDKIQARHVVEAALNRSGLIDEDPYRRSGDPVTLAQSRLLVQISKYSLSLKVLFRDEKPERGRQALEAVLSSFRDAQLHMQMEANAQSLEFLTRSKDDAERKLSSLRDEESRIRHEYGIVDDNPQQNIYTLRLRRLGSELATSNQKIAASGAAMEQVTKASNAEDPLTALLGIESIGRHPVVVEQQRLLYEYQARKVLLSQKYLEKHPRMIEIEQAIVAKREHLSNAVEMARSAIESTDRELRLQATEMKEQIKQAESDLDDYQRKLAELQALQREIETSEKILTSLREHLEEQQILAQLDATQITVIDPPSVNNRPVNIRASLFILISLFLGGVASLASTLTAEILGRRIRSASKALDLSHLSLLGLIPHANALKTTRDDPESSSSPAYGEAIRALRARLKLVTRGHHGPRVLMITSACPGDGKTSIAARLSASLSAAGDSVLVIEGDLRAPRLGTELGGDKEPGMVEFLGGAPANIQTFESLPNLSFILAGGRTENPAELIQKGNIAHLLADDFDAVADWIIIDTPPLGRVSDALAFGEVADFILLVAREDNTLRGDLRRTMAQLMPLQEKLLGLIYNCQRRSSESELLGYGYGYGPTYGFSTTRTSTRSGTSPDKPT